MTDHYADGVFDEDHAGDVADRIFRQQAIRQLAKQLGVLLICVISVGGTRVFGVLALWHVDTALERLILVAVLALDLAWGVYIVGGALRRTRRMTPTQQVAMAATTRRRTLPERVRNPNWWITRVLTAIYLWCLGIVVTDWTGSPAIGLVTAAAALLFLIGITTQAVRTSVASARVAQFGTDTGPKNSPEI